METTLTLTPTLTLTEWVVRDSVSVSVGVEDHTPSGTAELEGSHRRA